LQDLANAHGFKFVKDKVLQVNKDSFTLENGGERNDFDYLVLHLVSKS
jgi:sulfide:quinone oxidoreductase